VVLVSCVVVSLTAILAAVAWIAWGPQAAIVLIGFVGAITGFSGALIGLSNKLANFVERKEKTKRGVPQGQPVRRSWITVSLSMVVGVGLGYLALPGAVQWAIRPVVSIDIPKRVAVRQSMTLHWRNVPQGQRIWVLLYTPRDEVSFLQRCRSEGESYGTLTCVIEIGGTEDAYKEFQVRAVLTTPLADRDLTKLLNEPGYLRTYPSGVSLVDSVPVVRKP